MLIEIGHFTFILSFVLSIFLIANFFLYMFNKNIYLLQIQDRVVIWQFILLGFSLFSLVFSYAISDFSVAAVANSSYSEQSLFFKIAALGSNLDSSLLLWVFFLSAFTLVYRICCQKLHLAKVFNQQEYTFYGAVFFWQNFILATFSGFIFFIANPFLRTQSDNIQGLGLNPLLQDVALSIHPPLLYIGYAGLSLCFSYGMAGILCRKFDKEWVFYLKRWTLLAWIFLTLGIAIGAYWAYYELGWGGYWSWDPVENISLLPWLSALCLFHMTSLLEKRPVFQKFIVFLSLFSFFLVLLGFFLVRSGVLNSVHSFAFNKAHGIGLLLVMLVLMLPSFVLFIHFCFWGPKDQKVPLLKRDMLLLIALAFVFVTLVAILIGVLCPLVYQLFYQKQFTIDSKFYIQSCGLFMFFALATLMFMGVENKIKAGFLVLFFTLVCLIFFLKSKNSFYSIFFALGASMLVVFLKIFLQLCFKKALNSLSIGAFLGHIGLSLIFMAMALHGAFTFHQQYRLQMGEGFLLKNYRFQFDKILWQDHKNYSEQKFLFSVYDKDPKEALTSEKPIAHLVPAFRFFSPQNLKTNEVALLSKNLSQIYLVPVHEEQINGKEAYFFAVYWQDSIWLFGLAIGFMILGAFWLLKKYHLEKL